jgi:hypothetical protein
MDSVAITQHGWKYTQLSENLQKLPRLVGMWWLCQSKKAEPGGSAEAKPLRQQVDARTSIFGGPFILV